MDNGKRGEHRRRERDRKAARRRVKKEKHCKGLRWRAIIRARMRKLEIIIFREKIIIIDVHINLDDLSIKTLILLIFQYFNLIYLVINEHEIIFFSFAVYPSSCRSS